MDEPEYLEDHEIAHLHDLALKRHGGATGERDKKALQAAYNAPKDCFYYQSDELDERALIANMAACYWYNISQSNGFQDGNKRTAFYSCLAFLNKNGYDLSLTDAQAEEIGLRVGTDTLKRRELAEVIAPLIVPAS